MLRLKADPNVGGVFYGGKEYPRVKGFVTVPEEAAQELLGFGWGFTLASMQPAPEALSAQEAAPEGVAPPSSAAEGKSKK